MNRPERQRAILIVSQQFWPESFRINDLALGLSQLGYKVTVLTGKPNIPGGVFYPGYGFFKRDRERYEGVDVVRVPLIPRGKERGIRLILNYFSFAVFASLIGPFRVHGKFDVIFVFEPSPVTVGIPGRMFRFVKSAPMFFWVQDLWPESLSATGAVRSTWILKMVEWLVRFIYRGCDRILIQSEAFSASIEKLGAKRKRILYFPNSAEEIYKPIQLPEDAPERIGMPVGFRVMFAGNIAVAQDFDTILAAAERLRMHKDIHWLILGDGRMFTWLQDQVKKRGLEGCVHMLGRHPVESMPRYFSLADVMLVTLKKEPIFSLTIPSKIQSYLACAKPMVAALDGEGARIIEESKAGIATPSGEPEKLANSVLTMYKMSAKERQVMGECGRRYFESHFEREMLLKRLDGWITDIIAETRL